MAKTVAHSREYQVPALEKGLDILECLARQGVPLTQAQLARELGRGPNELFRMLVLLERRGYIQRDPTSGAYTLTLRLFELSHAHAPFQVLLRSARRLMRELTATVRESCHLGILHNGELLVLAQEESPEKQRLSIAVGATFPLLHTVSGRVLLAFATPQVRDDILNDSPDYVAMTAGEQTQLQQRFDLIRQRGYEEAHSETTEGVIDLSVLVGAPDGTIQAALTIACLGRKNGPRQEHLLPPLKACAHAISRTAGLIVDATLPDTD